MTTMSTGEVSQHLGFLVTKDYILARGLKPVEVIKSHPRWATSDIPKLCLEIAAVMESKCYVPSKVDKPSTKKPAAVDVSDL